MNSHGVLGFWGFGVLGIGISIRIGDWGLGLGLEIGIRSLDVKLGLRIEIGD